MPNTDTDVLIANLAATLTAIQESYADVQRVLDRDDQGWATLGTLTRTDLGFTHDFRVRHAARIRIVATANPIIKRGLLTRAAFIWGGGVQIRVRDLPDHGQDVGAVVKGFLDDPQNAGIADTDARLELEHELGIVGELFLCCDTDPVTGRVRVRRLPPSQITKIHTNPEDEETPQLYLRQWTAAGETTTRAAWYPALTYRPAHRDHQITWNGQPIEVRWDQPIRHVAVNRVAGRGIGDAFAAAPWADAYKGFLEDWAGLMRSLSRVAAQLTHRGDSLAAAAARLAAAVQGPDVGNTLVMDPQSKYEAVNTSGARFDADSGRPLAVMAAAALDLPVTTLLGDPGISGARAVAEQVSDDSWRAFDARQQLWSSVFRDLCGHVIDSAVIAPAGPLRGTLVRDGDRLTAELPDGDGRTVEIEWPDRDDTSRLDRVKAIQAAGASQLLPPLTELQMYLDALGVEDIEEVLDQVRDDHGDYVPPDVRDSQVRDRLTRAGGPQ